MDKLIDLQKKSFSGEELMRVIDNKANMLTYSELTKYDNINDCLKNGVLVLLYEIKPNYGHWCTVIKHGNNKLEFFDSYGMMPDSELKFISKDFRSKSNQKYPHLTQLLLDSGYDIEYNHDRLQDHTKNAGHKVATCGRHVACRIYFKKVPLTEYVKILTEHRKEGMTPDMIVTYITCFV